MKEVFKKIKVGALVAAGTLATSTMSVFADVGDDISKGIKDITKIIIKIADPIAILAVVIIGIYCIMGENETTKSKAKSWLIWIVIGLILINVAPVLIDTISGIGA